ncbi:MAG: SDR family oxidoreductase [Chthoniobacterales bacterium]|nr:SDR family oxidoreductase [Chthoniobacterales bacterium]
MIRLLLLLFAGYGVVMSAIFARRGARPTAASPSDRGARAPIRKILIIGATGGTGRELVKQGLAQGYEVAAFVRDPAKLQTTHPQLQIVRGDVLDDAAVEAAVRGQDAVLSSLGHRRLFVPSRTQSEGTRNVIRAMETHGVRRFICETALGLGSSAGKLGLFATFFFLPVVLPIYFWDKSRQEKLVAESRLDWVLVRPGVLTNEAPRGTYCHGHDVGSYISTGRVSRADVADFMLRQLNEDTYLHAAPGIVW